jgi:hypothetical protein
VKELPNLGDMAMYGWYHGQFQKLVPRESYESRTCGCDAVNQHWAVQTGQDGPAEFAYSVYVTQAAVDVLKADTFVDARSDLTTIPFTWGARKPAVAYPFRGLLARARARVEHDDLRTARVQLLLAVARARRCAGDDLLVLQAIEYFLVERDADVHGQ